MRIPRSLITAAPLLAVLALMVFFVLNLRQTAAVGPPDIVPSSAIDAPAPQFALPSLFAGTPGFRTADLNGRVTLVNFFASWCVPCRAEQPALRQAAQAGIGLVGIDYKDKPANAQAFLAELGNPYRVVAVDADGRAGAEFGINGVPQSYLIDRSGVIRFRLAGPLTPDIVRHQIVPLAARLK